MDRILLALTLTLLTTADAKAQMTRHLDSLIRTRLPEVAPGCAVLVAKDDRIIYQKGFGSANLELNTPMKPEMIFRIGSTTKQYTAIAILQLVEKGLLSLHDTIQRFLPTFPSKGHPITIENLLTHTSGIIDYQALDDSAGRNFYYRKDYTPEQVIDFFKDEPLSFIPGTRFAYSNSNYFLLGHIIELIGGMPYAQYMQHNIFDKARLTHTYYADYKPVVPGRVQGYQRYSGRYENADYLSMTIPFAAGALMTNVEDMFRWHEALYAGKLVRTETLQKAFTPYRLSDSTLSPYGYGWFIKDFQGSASIQHSGGVDGFQSDELNFPKEHVFVATLYNGMVEGGDRMDFMDLSNDIATLALGKSLMRAIALPLETLQRYVGTYAADSAHPVNVTVENGQLMIESPNGGLPKTPVTPIANNRFLLKVINVEFVFVAGKSGRITTLLVHVNGQEQVAPRVR